MTAVMAAAIGLASGMAICSVARSPMTASARPSSSEPVFFTAGSISLWMPPRTRLLFCDFRAGLDFLELVLHDAVGQGGRALGQLVLEGLLESRDRSGP